MGFRFLYSFIFLIGLGEALASNVWINEFHYDNTGSDSGEFFEVAGPAGTDLNGWSIVLYNGSDGTSYATIALSGTIDDESNGFGAISMFRSGIQNGGPDGIALVDNNGTLVEFISYEGSFTATNGPANMVASTDVGVSEPSTTPVGHSIQRTGIGNCNTDFTWSGPSVDSPGDLNTNQTITAVCPNFASLIIDSQNFNSLSSTNAATTDSNPIGSANVALTNSGSQNAGSGLSQFTTLWTDRSGNAGPSTNGTESDMIGVNSFSGSNAPDVSPDGASITSGTEHNFMFNDVDGSATLQFGAVNVNGYTDRMLDLNYWIANSAFEADDSLIIKINDGSTSVTLIELSGSTLDDSSSDDNGSSNWMTLAVNLDMVISANSLGSNISLSITVQNNADDENIFIDNIIFSGKLMPTTFTVTESSCTTYEGMHSGGMIDTTVSNCPAGSMIRFSQNDGPFTDTLPHYQQLNSIKVEATCVCIVDNTMTGDTVTVTTTPGSCPICPTLAPLTPVLPNITESSCAAFGGTVSGGSVSAPTSNCPNGSTLQYSVNDAAFSTSLPVYDQTTAIKIETVCICNATATNTSDTSMVTTVPGSCPLCPAFTSLTPVLPSITESTCNAFGGTVSGGSVSAPTSNCPNGSTLQYSVNDAAFSTSIPMYNQTTAIKIETACICNATATATSDTSMVTTVPGSCPVCPDLTTITPILPSISESECTSFGGMPTGGSVTAPTSNCPTGSTLQYSVDDGLFSTDVPSYNINSPVKIETACICNATATTTSDTSSLMTVPASCLPIVSFSLTDPCNCDDPRNCESGGTYYFHDTLTIPSSGTYTSGLDIRVFASTDIFIDVPCFGLLSEPVHGAAGTRIFEVGSTGVYKIEFWRPAGVLPTLTVGSGGLTMVVPPSTFEPICTTSLCNAEAIPTLGEWGIGILAILFMIFGVVILKEREVIL